MTRSSRKKTKELTFYWIYLKDKKPRKNDELTFVRKIRKNIRLNCLLLQLERVVCTLWTYIPRVVGQEVVRNFVNNLTVIIVQCHIHINIIAGCAQVPGSLIYYKQCLQSWVNECCIVDWHVTDRMLTLMFSECNFTASD